MLLCMGFPATGQSDDIPSAMLIENLQFVPTAAPSSTLTNFGTISLDPALELDGAGLNVDSIAFWDAPDPTNTLMFVTAKGNDLVEVWQFPFAGNELAPIPFPANVNGVAVDQETDLLYVSDAIVTVLSLPGLSEQSDFGGGVLGVGENNLDILKQTGGQTVICVSDDHIVHLFDATNHAEIGSFQPPVSSIETVLADDFYQMILVPEEQGPAGNPGVFAYHPDGSPFERGGTNRFGNAGEFEADEEGILLYTFPASGIGDYGTGFVVVSDQKSTQTDFEFFDRLTWAHIGTLRLTGVSNTDGIASTQKPLPGYPLGLFAAINNDTTTALLGWDVIFGALFTPYEFWAADHGLVAGLNAGFNDDPDLDGRPNGLEFATDGDPLSEYDANKKRVTIAESGGSDHFTYTCAVRTGAEFSGNGALASTIDGVVYTVAGANVLTESTDFNEDIVEVVPALDSGLPVLSSGWSYRTFRLSRTTLEFPTGFIRMAVGRSSIP